MQSKSVLPTLSQQVKKQMFWLGLLLFFTCLMLLLIFAWRSIDLIGNQLTNLQAGAVINQLKNNPNLSFPANRQNSVFKRWQDIPKLLREYVNYQDLVVGETFEQVIQSNNGKINYVYLLLKNDPQLGELIFISQHSQDEIEQLTTRFMMAAIKNAVWIVGIIFVLLFFIIRWLFYQSAQPLWQLSRWANNLTDKTKGNPVALFTNEETKHIAQQLFDNIQRIESFNNREREFLKHASHEFRTPLAIIQASLDTLELAEPCNRSVQRAMRATDNMNRLATSLLWIARESKQKIKKKNLNLASIMQKILTNLDYLMENKKIKLVLKVEESDIEIEKELLVIVLTNLIRNAFEHCSEGVMRIALSETSFEIENTFGVDEESAGFGLGLVLTEKICSKFGWQFCFSKDGDLALARVSWLL